MQALIWVVQIFLIVAWYAWPGFAAVPWWVIFLPALVSLFWLAIIVVVAAVVGTTVFMSKESRGCRSSQFMN